MYMPMDPNFDVNIYDSRYLDSDDVGKQTQMEREIKNRREQTNKEFARRMYRILLKAKEYGLNSLNLEELRFFKARFAYLNKADRMEFAQVQEMDLSHESEWRISVNEASQPAISDPKLYELLQKSRNQLNKLALENGVANPDKLPGKQAVAEAIMAIQDGAEEPTKLVTDDNDEE